ncbi:hypothetical protein [Breoghania sp.]|uniref:hypothetical protein n=1 Tax=Breoghania sp. TaxID=2065378 RepID=UPI002AA76EF8|nr:hypothetical protein [Breoghania sp.]
MSAPSRKSPAQKRAKRAEAQRVYREKLKRTGAPTRDDIARVALHWILTSATKNKLGPLLDGFEKAVVRALVDLGHSREKSVRVFGNLVEKYEDGWTPRRQPILRIGSTPPDDPGS